MEDRSYGGVRRKRSWEEGSGAMKRRERELRARKERRGEGNWGMVEGGSVW